MAEFDDAPLAIDKVALIVRDLDRVADFYRDVIGLAELRRDGESRALGAGDRVLLELRRDAHARERSPRDAGLFHTAFLLPTRGDLGRWLRHMAEKRLPLQGASDHVVSEAVYLADPEGNGIEIYADRSRAAWTWTDGLVAMRTDRLDTDALIRAAGSEPWQGAPAGTTVGHVHLQVGAVEPADIFYNGLIGLDVTARYPGASFFSSGGYHHHLAANVWNSRGAAPRAEPTTGLAEVAIRLRDPAFVDRLAAKATGAGVAAERDDGGLALRDPWGTRLRFAPAP
ncbi:VOC family protein [Aureimonas leprariae]|uniref:VOC family protein n=1 Tax=Plantimonas leprariae TaxID=2615207 RepID=A0A7V7PM23_9HYPH|nr:VOC family protein [Aureimonas leprariae]KAB0677747.1 VOC family protein [Aureimonas leprariae]